MDNRFLELYEVELGHLRKVAAEFGQEFPKVANRLALTHEPPDPYVERLLEGFAFMAARVQLKLEAEFPRFTQALLETVYPHYLAPTPAMAMLKFEIDRQDNSMPGGFPIPRGTAVRSILGRGDNTHCVFTTAHPLTLWPLEIHEAGYFTREMSDLNLPAKVLSDAQPKAALRLRLQATAGFRCQDLNLERLPFYLSGTDDLPGLIYEQLLGHAAAVVLQSAAQPVKLLDVLPASCLRRVGFTDEEALLPPSPQSFSGYRLLREYFAFHQRFLFAEVTGLRAGFKRCEHDLLDLIILLNQEEPRLERRVTRQSFDLFCTPAINLFHKDGIRVDLKKERPEYQVVPDRLRTIDYEVFDIQRVTGMGVEPGERPQFHSFYRNRERGPSEARFYTVQRVPRLLTERERERKVAASNYLGAEVFISIVDANAAPYSPNITELDIEALCTNRHLPIQMSVGAGTTDFHWDFNAPITAVRCLAKTDPVPSVARGQVAWKLISHLSLNYLSLLEANSGGGAVALQEMLRLYANPNDYRQEQQILGLKSIRSAPVVRRIDTGTPIAFGRGLRITLQFDEKAFAGVGPFLFSAVLEQFLARYVSLNSFTETVVVNEQAREIMRWPAQTGKRLIL